VEASVCGDDALPAKPAAEVLEHLAGRLGVPVDRMMMVGDTVCDLHAGRNAGAGCCVGVTSGTSDRDTLSPLADAVLGTVHELKIDC
jgi:phosphoglycolate phosphatase